MNMEASESQPLSAGKRTFAALTAFVCGFFALVLGVLAISFLIIAINHGFMSGEGLMAVVCFALTTGFTHLTIRSNKRSKPPVVATAKVKESSSPPSCCDDCGKGGDLQKVTMHGHMGMILVFIHRTHKGFLCRDCINKSFWKLTTATFFLGWWGLLSIIITPICLVSNLLVLVRSRKLRTPKKELRTHLALS